MTDLSAAATEYRRNGFIACEGLLASDEVAALKAETMAIVRGERGDVVGAQPSAERSDDELLGEAVAIHFPHKISALMHEAMSHPKVVEVLRAIIGPDIKAMQTMLFVKKAGKPGQAWHQDEYFIPTRDRSLCGAWVALDDATVENGCMWMHPGSQAPGVLYRMRPHGDPRFDSAHEAWDHPYEGQGGVPVELKAGGIAFFNGYVLHRSLPNRAPSGFRRALVTHYMSAASQLPWDIGRPKHREDARDIVMIAGTDPYAWRGLESLAVPYVRPENPARAAEVYAEARRRSDQA
ncbi:MAG TPA: phytanoyl-CoA dioxygenase family protein [Caulobacteraceae bacterium]|nr:phytanoyl-CoA dioxygenase family protein [Caulobacteraceae bacterium]